MIWKRASRLAITGTALVAITASVSRASADDVRPAVRPAVYRVDESVGASPQIQLVRHGWGHGYGWGGRHWGYGGWGYGGRGYGWGGGYRGWGGWGYRPYGFYRPYYYGAYAYPYGGYYGYGYPGYGYGYGAGIGIW